MKAIFLKIFFLISITLVHISCRTVSNIYSYYGKPIIEIKKSDSTKKIDFEAYMEDIGIEISPIRKIGVYYLNYYKEYPEILSPTIKVVDNLGKEYILNVDSKYKNSATVYEQGVILQGDFKVYIGKVRIEDGSIIDLPPIVFKQYVHSSKSNLILGALKIDTSEFLFQGTVEEYKKGEWKKKKE